MEEAKFSEYAPCSVGVNGFGRIGRLFTRASLLRKTINVVAINDPFMSAPYMAYLLSHDSVHGHFKLQVDAIGADILRVEGQNIKIYNCKDATQIPWRDHQIQFVAETSGVYTTVAKASDHLKAGAEFVVISAPPKDELVPMLVVGVNHTSFDPAAMKIVSNASCTTNCLAPLAMILDDNFGVIEGLMSTIHAVTASQMVVDGPSMKDWRAGRAAGLNIIPASTGAAKAVGKVLPQLHGKLTGMAFRVPTADVSVLDLTVRVERPIADMHAVVRAIERNASEQDGRGVDMRGIIGVTTEDVVSSDFVGDSRSCVVDFGASLLLNPTFVKIVAYYDNEWAYSMRLVLQYAPTHCCLQCCQLIFFPVLRWI